MVFHNIICSFDILCSLVERARKTVRGSADDIGWLQRDQSLPTTEDWTARFLELLDSVRSAKAPNWTSMQMICKNVFNERCNLNYISWEPSHTLSEKMSTSYLIQLFTCWFQVSPLLLWLWAISFQLFYANIFIGLFSNHGYFSKMGLACHIAKVHTEVLSFIIL